jgi:hypothetical protein
MNIDSSQARAGRRGRGPGWPSVEQARRQFAAPCPRASGRSRLSRVKLCGDDVRLSSVGTAPPPLVYWGGILQERRLRRPRSCPSCGSSCPRWRRGAKRHPATGEIGPPHAGSAIAAEKPLVENLQQLWRLLIENAGHGVRLCHPNMTVLDNPLVATTTKSLPGGLAPGPVCQRAQDAPHLVGGQEPACRTLRQPRIDALGRSGKNSQP